MPYYGTTLNKLKLAINISSCFCIKHMFITFKARWYNAESSLNFPITHTIENQWQIFRPISKGKKSMFELVLQRKLTHK